MEYSGFQRSRSLPRAWFRWKWCPRASKPKPSTAHHPLYTTTPRTLPPPPLDPANFQQSSVLLLLLPSSPSSISNSSLRLDIISPARAYLLAEESKFHSLSLSPSLSLPVLETKFKLDTANNGAPMGKYDSSNFVFPLP